MPLRRRPGLACTLAAGLFVAACSAGGNGAAKDDELIGHVASYDLAASGPQRFLLGVTSADQAMIVGGEIALRFRRLGHRDVHAVGGRAASRQRPAARSRSR